METIQFELHKHVGHILLNRPKVLNALNETMINEFTELMIKIKENPDLKVIVLSSTSSNFMAGGDIQFFLSLESLEKTERKNHVFKMIERVNKMILSFYNLPQITIARVRGAAAGFGLSFVLASDLAYLSPTAQLTCAYTQIGTTPDGGCSYGLTKAVGAKKAMEMVLFNQPITAEEALDLGLANAVIDDNQLNEYVQNIAQKLGLGPRLAFNNAKQLIKKALDQNIENHLISEAHSFAECTTNDDFIEGIKAFLEKRHPQFAA